MKMLRFFFKRISDDFMQKKLIPLKVLFFVHASTVFVLYPYLTIHMRELGINVEETAIMSAVTPVASIVMPPLAGMLADKIGNFKFLLVFSSILGGMSALLLLAVPVGRITVTFPPSVELLATCESSALRLRNMQEYSCLPVHPYAHDINLTVVSCGFVCELPEDISPEDVEDVVHSPAYDVHLRSSADSRRMLFRHTVTSRAPRSDAPVKDRSTSRILTNDPYFNSSVTRVSDNEVFFPTPQLYDMECSWHFANETCLFGNSDMFAEGAPPTKQQVIRARITHDAQKTPDDVRSYWVKGLAIGNVTKFNDDYDGIDMVTCQDKFDTVDDRVEVVSGPRRMTRCAAACAASVPRPALCANKQQQIELDPVFTFWCYLAVRVFIGVIGGTAFAVFEGAVIAIVREQRADYGMQRVYGSLGGMLSSPLSGLLIDYASKGKGYTDFRPAFYLYAVLKVATGVLMMSIDLDFKQPAQNLLKDVVSVFKNFEFVALFVACFIMGTAWGYIESFLFWLLQDLGASRSLMGVTITVGGVAGLPLLVLSGPIIRRLGHANVLFIGFLFYAIRLMGYSLIYNPWLCLIFEALESVTSSLSFTAAVTYAARLSTSTTDTSVQGLLGGLYYGVGKGSGSLIGGYLMKFFGIRPTYRIFAYATFITGCIYFLLNRFYIRQRAASDENDICKKHPDDAERARPDRTGSHGADEHLPDRTGGPGADGHTPLNDEKVKTDAAVKLVAENSDGGSDSGVENPAYVETEATSDGTRREGPNTG